MPPDPVIGSTARTPIGKAYRGAFNATPSPTLASHAIRAAVERAGVAPEALADGVMGAPPRPPARRPARGGRAGGDRGCGDGRRAPAGRPDHDRPHRGASLRPSRHRV